MPGLKILVMTFGNRQAGSTKYRICQYESFFRSQGAEIEYVEKKDVDETFLDKVAQAYVLINQKCLLPIGLSKKIIQQAKRVIFDFDDAIYTRPGRDFSWLAKWRVLRRMKLWLRESDIVTTANQYLADFARRDAKRVEVLPMTLDLSEWMPRATGESEAFHIGWAGAPSNLHHIERLGPLLSSLLKKNPQVRLMIYSGKRPNLECPYEFVPFQDGSEPSFIQRLQVGLLPLTNEEFSRGKSPIKAIQYLACGVAVVGNIYGATAEILNPENSVAISSAEEWEPAIQSLIDSPEKAKGLGQKGRKHVEELNDKSRVEQRFWRLLSEY